MRHAAKLLALALLCGCGLTAHAQDVTNADKAAILRAIEPCWALDAQHPNPAVEIRLHINPDGTVRRSEVLDQERYASDRDFRAAVDRARRSLMNPVCNKLPIPAGGYENLKTMIVNFDPKDFGR